MTSPQKPDSVYRRFSGKGVFPYQMAFTLLIPLRNIYLSPGILIKRLELKSNHTVLEIGPGPGYFSVEVARYLSQGTLFLFDIQQQMLDMAQRRLEKRGLSNVQYYLADRENFPFADRQFDRVFMVTVLGEVENKEVYVREITRTLKDNGMVSVSELAGDPDKMKPEEIIALFETAGLTCCRHYRKLGGYTLSFTKQAFPSNGH